MKLKQTIRTAILYIATVVLVGGVPLTAFADHSDACIAAGHKGKKWVLNPATGKCVKASTLPSTPTDTSTNTNTPDNETSPSSQTTTDTDTTETPSPKDAPASSQPPVTPAPTDGTNATTTTSGSSNATDNNTNSVTTGVQATSTSGDAKVQGNQSQGSAGTGDASADTTVINSVHSTVDGDTSGVAHFTANLNGDVTGDITLGPTIDGATADGTTNLSGNTNVNNKTSLTNDISLAANSGDATVRGNQSQGSATTGNANTVADVLNLINTIIAANKSFVGTINIYGNLNGDILISPEFIPQLLASNAGSQTNVNVNMPLSTNINDDQTIVNNVKLNATTGSATVAGNSTSGGATTGTSMTNLTILNLTGHQVNAANSLLVFVNVLGKWVGMIVDAPGATAAALGSGIVSSTTNLSNQANLNNTAGITNNINLSSQSGNALVAGNSSGGSAASGNATASANIANISTSTFNLSGWFGILYINVFGTWLGSFGVNTANGDVVPLAGAPANSGLASPSAPALHLGFIPHAPPAKVAQMVTQATGGNPPTGQQVPQDIQGVLASAKTDTPSSTDQSSTLIPEYSSHARGVDPIAIAMMVSGGVIALGPLALGLLRRRSMLLAFLRP